MPKGIRSTKEGEAAFFSSPFFLFLFEKLMLLASQLTVQLCISGLRFSES